MEDAVSLISFSVHLPLEYRKAPDLFEQIWYSTILLKEFISFRSYSVVFLGSVVHTIISSANKDTLTSSFKIYIPLISFSSLIALANTSRAILKLL